MEPVTKADLDEALRAFVTKTEFDKALRTLTTKDDLREAVAGLRVEWRNEIVNQTRWLATLFIAQFFGTLAAVWFMLSRLHP